MEGCDIIFHQSCKGKDCEHFKNCEVLKIWNLIANYNANKSNS